MKKYIYKRRGFLTIDLVVAIAVFSILSAAAISITASYEKNVIISQKKQEMNFYIESIAKEIKYNVSDSDITKIHHKYINKDDIQSDKIEKDKLVNILDDSVDDKNLYVEVNLSDDRNLYIKYVNNKIGVSYSDEENIKIT